MNDIAVNNKIIIENLIYEVRGKHVIMDSDIAELYGCVNGTKDINKAVKRNIERFPESFMFQLTDEEQKEYTEKYDEEKRKFIETKRELTDFKIGLVVPGMLKPMQIDGGTLLVEAPYHMRPQ